MVTYRGAGMIFKDWVNSLFLDMTSKRLQYVPACEVPFEDASFLFRSNWVGVRNIAATHELKAMPARIRKDPLKAYISGG